MAQNKTGPIIGMAVSSLLSVIFAVVAYMNHTDNQLKQAALTTATNEQQTSRGTIEDQKAQVEALKSMIGTGQTDVGHSDASDGTVIKSVNDLLARVGGDGTAAPQDLLAALNQKYSESNRSIFTADDRKKQADVAAQTHQQSVQSKDAEIAQFKAARDAAEANLVKKEQEHSEQMARLEDQNKALRAEIADKEEEFDGEIERMKLEIEQLNKEFDDQRTGLVMLRSRRREKEDASFSKPNGVITTVDQKSNLCYLNIGQAAGLRPGTKFSVYRQDSSGTGRASTADIKAEIEVVSVLGPRQAEARIIDEKNGEPVSPGDPFYSPLFQAGRAMEILVAGQIRLMGLNREEFRRLVRSNGAKIAVEISDDGEFLNEQTEQISEEKARELVTPGTRFLVIGDLEPPDGSDGDPTVEAQYKAIRDKTEILKKEAENRGIYPIGLSSFLEHIGVSG
ncbi:MAG: hypothetical protein R3C49_04220 [Planctomycetaceae bacterium]